MASRKILVQEDYVHVSSGSNPAAGFLAFYPKSDNNFYLRTSAGVERRLLTSDDSFWTASGNNIYNANAGNVGIGTNNPTAKLDVDGNIRATSIDLVKPALNSVNLQLSDPTVEEMSLLHGVVNNKLRFKPPDLQEESSDGTNWIVSSRATANQLADLMIGEGQVTNINAIIITGTGQQGHYRLTWNYFGSYIYLTSLYVYGVFNETVFKIEGLSRSTGLWESIAEGSGIGSPRHVYIPHTRLRLHGSSYYSKARITFSVFSSTTTYNVTLNSLEWLGTYPIGRRNVETYDRDKNVTFPNQIIGQSFKSLVPTGTAPFVIASTTVNTNLNADLLDGQHASAFAPTSHNHSFAGLSDVALVSPSAGQMLLYNGSNWVNTDHITSLPGAEYNTIQIKSKEIVDDFGNAEIYMSAEEGIIFRTNISKPDFAEVTFNKFGISSSKLAGTGERYLSADSSGIIKVATVQPTQYWERDAGNFNVSPVNPADEVHAWLFKAGGVLISDGYLETGRSGMYTVYNDMVVSEYYLTNNTFYYANSKVAFNNSTNRLTVSGDIDAGENLLFAGQGTLKAKDGGLLWISGYRLNGVPTYLLNGGYLGQIIFGTINDQGGYSQQGVIYSKATQNHSASNKGTNLEFWNTPNNTYAPRKVAELRQDGFFDSAYGFAVGGSDGQSGTATILTGCSYNSVTKTLIYTRASVTFSGGIVTSIASMSSLSVPLS